MENIHAVYFRRSGPVKVSHQKNIALEESDQHLSVRRPHMHGAYPGADSLTRYFIAVSALSAVPHTGGVALSATHPTPHLQA